MERRRSQDMETNSAPTRVLPKDAVGTEQVKDRAIVKAKLWPGSADKTIIAPGAVGETHLDADLAARLGRSTVHHVTASVSGASIADGGAKVEWTDEAGAPNERRGFETFHQQLQAGSVGDIPIDRDGHLILFPELQFEDSATEEPLDETGVDVTVKVQRIRDGVVTTYRGALTGTDAIGVSGPLDGWVNRGDHVKVTIDPGESIKVSGTLQAALFVTSQSVAPSWTQVFEGDAHGIVFDGTYWWATEGNSGTTVFQYDTDWALQGTFETDYGSSRVRGITSDGTDLWITGASAAPSGGDRVKQYNTSGTKLSEFASDDPAIEGVAYDGTDLWVAVNDADEILRFDTSGTLQSSFTIPDANHSGLAYHDGKLYLTDESEGTITVYGTDGTLIDTIDVSAATASPSGVWLDGDGTLYVAEDGVGVWRRD